LSIESLRRARTDQKGFALLSAFFLAILYFALMELMLHSTTESLRETQRGTRRIAVEILADNAAELGAENLVKTLHRNAKLDSGADRMRGSTKVAADGAFTIEAEGHVGGAGATSLKLVVAGRIAGSDVLIERISYAQP
jgi:uncharacterized protein YbjQ (UPF0145 family)